MEAVVTPESDSADRNDQSTRRFSRRSLFAGGAAGAGALVVASAFPALVRAAGGATTAGALDDLLAAPPFSFTYGGTASATLLASWTKRTTTSTLADGSEQTLVTWTDPVSGLIVRWTALTYPGYPHVSWVVAFENGGRSNSAAIADVLALDLDVTEAGGGPAGSDWTVHTGIGSNQGVRDFRPFDLSLAARGHRLFTTEAGRPSSYGAEPDGSGTFVPNGWPYFNVEWGGTGLVVALGWQGQWALEVDRVAAQALRLRGGMCQLDTARDGDRIAALQLTDLWLAPGESIRTPMVVIQPWSEPSWLDAQNTWRRWMVDFHLPRDGSGPPQPHLSGTQYSFSATAEDQLRWLDAYGDRGQTLLTGGGYDHWWVDAGWYEGAAATGSGWQTTGTWEVNASRFPRGMSEVAARARELGMSMILWFEPERVRLGTWLATRHPGWLLSPPAGYDGFLRSRDDRLLNFGDPDARDWAIAHVNGLLAAQTIDQTHRGIAGFYREDSNIEPLPFWNAADPSGRRGLTQARHVAGHLAYWAAIRAANPTLMIDTCASGGRRVDVESLRYSIPLLRSDLVSPPVAAQCQNYGLSLWLPVSGNQAPANADPGNGYVQRSAMAPCWDLPMNCDDASANWPALAATTAEWKAISGSYLGDYHPLTPYSSAEDQWMAWQYNARDGASGSVQAFRRPGAAAGSQRLLLRGLDRAARYTLRTYAATTRSWTASSGFADTQGANQWRYQVRSKSTGIYTDGTYSAGAWYGPAGTGGGYVAAGSQHPDNSYDAVRTWIAPAAGIVRVTGRVSKQDTGGGNGVVASVLRNGTTLWTRTIGATDGTGYTTDADLGSVAVAAGDALRFVVGNNGDWANDATLWNPTVAYVAEQAWIASAGFGSTQGADGWRYQARDRRSGVVSDLTWGGTVWATPRGGYVAAGSQHPDETYDVLRTWVAPSAATVRVGGRVSKQETGGGDGVVVSVLRNGTALWTRTLAFDDATGYATGYATDADLGRVPVAAGDTISFAVACNGDYTYDGTLWDPAITVVAEPSWRGSADFGDAQGARQWRYQTRDKSSGAFADCPTYRAGAWYGPLGTSGGYVASGSQHPDNSYDLVRTWVAPYAGKVRVGGRVRKQDTGGGNGVVASVLRNTTSLWSRTIAFDDATGRGTSADLGEVTVAAGDALRFVVANNGDYAYDATYWDPFVMYVGDREPVTTTATQTGASLEDDGLSVSLGAGAALTVAYAKA
jgi:Melibiase